MQLEEAEVSEKPFWDFRDLLLFVGLLVASLVILLAVVSGLAFLYPKLREDSTPLLLPMQFALYAAVYLVLRIVLGSRYRKPVFPSLGWVRSSTVKLSYAVAGGVALAFGVAGLAAAVKTPSVKSPIEGLMHSPVLLAIFGVMAITIAPLFEELVFRGFLQPLLTGSLGSIAGVLVTAALFGLLHAPEYQWAWQYAVAVGSVGAVLGWVRLRSRSIVPGTVMHGAYNSVFIAALLISRLHPAK